MESIIVINNKARRPVVSDMKKLLSPINKELIEEFENGLEQIYRPSHVISIIREALKYMIRLQNAGHDNALESSNRSVVDYCYAMESMSDVVINQRIGYLRIFLDFLSKKYRLTPSLEMTANIFMYDRIVFIEDLPETTRSAYEAAAKPLYDNLIGRERYWSYACALCAMFDEYGYAKNTKSVMARAWRSFYVFMCANGFDYTPELAAYWVEETIVPALVYWRAYRRAFALLEHYAAHGHIEPGDVCCRKGRDIGFLPAWCADPMQEHLLARKQGGFADSSLTMQRSCTLRFLEYLLERGAMSWADVTPQLVMDFHVQDAHSTVAAKNAYASKIRHFLGFLAEQGLVAETLQLAMPSSKVKEVSLVEVFSETELEMIDRYRSSAITPIELRSICMVLLGLRLGLRGCDIVNLKLTDICWQMQKLSIIQRKTGVGLTLPLPIEVANSLFRYITEGRPETSSVSIFVRHHAPFCELKRSACGAALARVLRDDSVKMVGFHITRKTFASRMLSASVPVDTIADALGQTTTKTVHKYVSTDEAGMRLCAIPLTAITTGKEVMAL